MGKIPSPLRKIFQKQTQGRNAKNRAFALFSWPVLAAGALVLACAIGWSFFIGYMVGKGQNPEKQLQSMGLLKKEEPDKTAEAMVVPPVPPEQVQQQDLPNQPAPAAPAPDIPEAGATSAPPTPALPFSRPEGVSLAAWGETPPEQEATRAKPSPQPEKRQLYNYSFQVAAFRTEREAGALETSLKARGIRASRKKSGKVTLVMANLKGTEADAEKLVAALAALKLGKPLVLAKKPVVPQKNKKAGK